MSRDETIAVELRVPELPSLNHLPYPIALTARRMVEEVRAGRLFHALSRLKDCFEATIKYLGFVLLTEYFSSPACTAERSESLAEKLVRPSLGDWTAIVRDLSGWLVATGGNLGRQIAGFFTQSPKGRSPKQQPTDLSGRCSDFVKYRNDTIGHGVTPQNAACRAGLEAWLPLIQELLDAVATLQDWHLILVNDRDCCQVWMGPEPSTVAEPGKFRELQIGHFVLRGPSSGETPGAELVVRDLYPFICYLPDSRQQRRLYFYDSVRYQETRKEIKGIHVLDYDDGLKQETQEPVAGLEARFTSEVLARACIARRPRRMTAIEGQMVNFGDLLTAHADIVGRRFAVEHVKRFIEEHDRGMLLIEAEPGRGKTALLCHLIEKEFGDYSPPPVYFFYRRTAGITDPDVCVKSLYASLLEAHGIEELEESQRQDSPEAVYHKLVNLLSQSIAPRLAPSRPQLIFIDALDEAEATSSGATAYQRIPENLPAGVYVIATGRPVRDRVLLARRSHLECYDLDSPDLLQEHLRDGADFAARELVASQLPNETLDEIARVGRGNFLVLTEMCKHVPTCLNPDDVRTYLSRVATAPDQLGFIYEEFWSRMIQRASLDEQQCLGDVAGLLVAARAPVPAELICRALNVRAAAWDWALRRLVEYLTVRNRDEDEASENVYRIYHEAFAEFLRSKLATDRDRYKRVLAEYCLCWAELPASYTRQYALRFGPTHLMAAGQWDALETLLTDLAFLEAKTGAGMVFELAEDFAAAARLLPEDRPQRRTLKLLDEALRRDIHFIHRHATDYPQGLFQCLWNTCWWYDCEEAAAHYVEPEWGWNPKNAPWMQPADQKLCRLLERWRDIKLRACPGLPWIRTHRPPSRQLGTGQLAVLPGHGVAVNSVKYSLDGARIITGSRDGTISVWGTETGAELAVFSGHEGEVNSVACSPDGRRVASASLDHTIRVWDAESGTSLAVLRGHEDSVTSLAYSPDGRRIVSGSTDGAVRVWEAESGGELTILRRHGDSVKSVTYSPNSQQIASSSSGGTIQVWDAESGAEFAVWRVPGENITSLVYSPDGRHIAIGSSDKTILVWDAVSGAELVVLRGHQGPVVTVAYSPDGRCIASGSRSFGNADDAVRVWDSKSGVMLAVLRGHGGGVTSVAYSPNGRQIAGSSYDGTVRLWDADSRTEPAALRGHGTRVTSVGCSAAGRQIVSGSWDGMVRLWDPETGIELAVICGCKDDVNTFAYSPDGRRIVSGDGTFRLWDAKSGAMLAVLHARNTGYDYHITFSPDGGRIAITRAAFDEPRYRDFKILVWDAERGIKLAVLRGHSGNFLCTTYSPDGQQIATGSEDSTVCVWDAENGAKLAMLRGHEDGVVSVAYSSDGCRIVSTSYDGTIRVWDAQTHKCLEVIEVSGESEANAAGVPEMPLRPIARVHETVIEQTRDGEPLAWFPTALEQIAAHPSGQIWVGAASNHLFIIRFEGITELARQEDITKH